MSSTASAAAPGRWRRAPCCCAASTSPSYPTEPSSRSPATAGAPCTHAARQPLPQALVALDSGLRQGVTSPRALRHAAYAWQGTGCSQARRAVALADARAGPAPESLARGHLLEAHVRPLEPQLRLVAGGHPFDLGITGKAFTVVEVDGAASHRARDRFLHDLDDGLVALREDWQLVRVGYSHVAEDPAGFVDLVLTVVRRQHTRHRGRPWVAPPQGARRTPARDHPRG